MAKVDPYLRPLFDALYDMLEPEKVNQHLERGVIEVAPLAFMRGRTLNDSFIILDEAQNTSPEQIKMFLTRLGFNSKMVVTGDVTQIDLPKDQRSGLLVIGDILEDVEGIEFVRFGGEDVVRHKLVQRIVAAYNEYAENAGPAAPRGPAPRTGLIELDLIDAPGELRAPAEAALRAAGVAEGHLALALVGEEEIRRLNREHRGLDRPTDVLSFPVDERERERRAARAGRRGGLPRAHRPTWPRRSCTACSTSAATTTSATTARCSRSSVR